MPETPLSFAILDGTAGMHNCSICGINPATLGATGTHEGPCCLQCAFSLLADLAHSSIDDSIKRMG